MAEEFESTPNAQDPTEVIPVPDAEAAAEPILQPTEPIADVEATVEIPPQPTERIADATEELPAKVEATTPMPNAFAQPSQTTPMPEPMPEPEPAPAPEPPVTTAGFDVEVTQEAQPQAAPAIPTAEPVQAPFQPATPANPYADAAAAAGFVAGAAAAQTNPVYAQPAEPWRQASQQQAGVPRPTYADPDYRAGAYQNAVPHQPFTPDPTVANPYEFVFTQLTGGMKFGWLVVGLFLNIPGMVLAWLVNADKHPQVKKDAIVWSVIGFAINVVLTIIAIVFCVGIMAAVASRYGGYYF